MNICTYPICEAVSLSTYFSSLLKNEPNNSVSKANIPLAKKGLPVTLCNILTFSNQIHSPNVRRLNNNPLDNPSKILR